MSFGCVIFFRSDKVCHEHGVVDGELREGVCGAVAFGVNDVVHDAAADREIF